MCFSHFVFFFPRTEPPSREQVKKASEVMDKLLEELGMNENTIIEDTHKCIGQSESKRKSFDERFRRHIRHARDMLDVPAHQRHSDIVALRRSLEDDQAELNGINEQMALCRNNIMSYLKIQVAEFCAKVRVGLADGGDACNVDSMTSFIGGNAASTRTSSVSSFIDSQSSQPQTTDNTASIAESRTHAERLIPSAMSQSFHQPEPLQEQPIATITLQAPVQPIQTAPMAAFIQSPRPYIVQQQRQQQLLPLSHEIGMQRHFDSAPNPSNTLLQRQPSVLYQPHLDTHPQAPLYKTYASQSFPYRQPLAYNRLANLGDATMRQNYQMFRQQSAPPSVMNEAYHGLQEQQHLSMVNPQVNFFQQQKPAVAVLPATTLQQPQQFIAFHSPPVVAYPQPQFHARAEQKHITSRPYPFINYPAASPIITSFAGNNNKNKKLSDADHHHSSTSSDQGEKDDSPSSLWFPGTTYSPPPSYLKGQNIQEPSNQLSVPNQPQYPNYSPVVPFTPPFNHPPITEIAGEKHKEGEPGEVAPYSSLKPYNPFTQPKTAAQAVPLVHPFVAVPFMPITNSFASPQQGSHEVIKTGPPTETMTVNQAAPSPSPAKTDEPEEEHNGPLPGYVGAVDLAKYPEDSTDRMRPDKDKNKDEDSEKGIVDHITFD